MNTISLNSLWTYLQSLGLTTSNKTWLAEHLYEDAEADKGASQNAYSDMQATLLQEEELPEIVRKLIGATDSIAADDINGREAYYSHLEQKYS